jgi:predicted Zn-dependent protease
VLAYEVAHDDLGHGAKARRYSRTEEYAADRHGMDILTRAGYSKNLMIDALT